MKEQVMDTLAPPYVVAEMEPSELSNAVRLWRSEWLFDTTDNGRLEPLPEFLFELRPALLSDKRSFRLYMDGKPCIGCQWQYDVEGALRAVDHVTASYAYHRRASIHAHHQALLCELRRAQKEETKAVYGNDAARAVGQKFESASAKGVLKVGLHDIDWESFSETIKQHYKAAPKEAGEKKELTSGRRLFNALLESAAAKGMLKVGLHDTDWEGFSETVKQHYEDAAKAVK